jgi:Rps23 Pro-64 3,4-dihydroxylase Tpa1-like proline 4-hydroxylase
MQWFEDVLNEDDYAYVVEKTLHGDTWKFTGFSTLAHQFIMWFMELREDNFFTEKLLCKIEELAGKKFEIERVYANGQTHGLPGDFHRDKDLDTYQPELYYTFVYYVNPEWDVRWGGQTVIVTEDGKLDTVYPKRNCGILFNSTLLHFGDEPSRHCRDLRVTVAFKLKEIL